MGVKTDQGATNQSQPKNTKWLRNVGNGLRSAATSTIRGVSRAFFAVVGPGKPPDDDAFIDKDEKVPDFDVGELRKQHAAIAKNKKP